MKRTPRLSRRGFLKTAAVTAGAVAVPNIVPASALGLDGTTAPSNRLVLGCIGVGSQGSGNMGQFLEQQEVQIVAVCDVDRAHREKAQGTVNETYSNRDCAGYNDFRELIARGDLDAVSIAVPDHWHAIPAIAAAEAGLDLYAEKPLALTIRQGRAMVEAVHKNNRVWQTGSWQRSQNHFRHACELVRSGRIGDVHTVKVGLPTGKPIGPQPEMPVPDGFDYEFWLGPAPWEPYTKERCHWNFRWILDYSGGQLTDWAAHHVDIANWGMGTEGTGPVRMEGVGNFPREGLWDAATEYQLVAKYAPGASPVAPRGFEMHIQNEHEGWPMGTRFEGSDGWIWVDRGGRLQSEPENLKTSVIGENDVQLYNSDNHFRNFIECTRSRKETVAPISAAHHAINLAHLGNISMLLERALDWNPKKEEFEGDPIANRMLDRAMRGPWRL